MWNEFKPAFRFLLVFLGLYLAGNILYGLWITSFHGLPDPATRAVSFQTSKVLGLFGYPVSAVRNVHGPTVFMMNEGNIMLNIYEGCNGINVMIVFAAFVVAFGGRVKRLGWFLPAGMVIIHMSNIVRIALLYFVAVGYQHYFYYVHKYVFTAAIYLIVFLLWVVWVAKVNGRHKKAATV
jgi:exosortase family protein XrtF